MRKFIQMGTIVPRLTSAITSRKTDNAVLSTSRRHHSSTAAATSRSTVADTAHAARLAAVIARNVAIDMLRWRRPTSISGDEAHTSWLLQQESDNNTPESQLEWKEDELWLRQRIEQLPPREMQVMRLRQTERRTNEQIAAILGISKDSVATMLSSARRKLFNQIKERNRT